MLAANGRVFRLFRLSFYDRGPRQGPGYSASSRSVKSKSLSPMPLLASMETANFILSFTHIRVCLENGNAVTQFEPFEDSFKAVVTLVFSIVEYKIFRKYNIDCISRKFGSSLEMKFRFLLTIYNIKLFLFYLTFIHIVETEYKKQFCHN